MAVPLMLNVFKGEKLLESRRFERDIIKIGRLSSANLCLDDDKVSRIHSVIEADADGTLSIVDMGSVEGTWVNGKRVNKGALTFGDRIRLGDTTLQLVAVADELAKAAREGDADGPTRTDVVPAAALGQTAEAGGSPSPVALTEAPAADAGTAETLVGGLTAQDAVDSAYPMELPGSAAPQGVPSAPSTENQLPEAPARDVTAPPFYPVASAHDGPLAVLRSATERPPATAKGPRGLELRLLWGASLLETRLFDGTDKAFRVGEAQGVHFAMGTDPFDGDSFDLVRWETAGPVLRFTASMRGEVTRGNEVRSLTEEVGSGALQRNGGICSLPLAGIDLVRVEVGELTCEIAWETLPKPVIVPWSETADFAFLNMLLVLLFIGALFVISAKHGQIAGQEYADDLGGKPTRVAKLIVKRPEQKENPFLKKLSAQKEQQAAAKAATKKAPQKSKPAARRSRKPAKKAAAAPRPSSQDQAKQMAEQIFGGRGGLQSVIGSGGIGDTLQDAMSGMDSGTAGVGSGVVLKGSSEAGGGQSAVGIGAIGTKGRGGGTGAYGKGVGVLSGKKGVDIGITSSEPVVMGSLDAELVRKVIQANSNQIRYCYESLLARFPSLGGKVAVKFVITGSGRVASSEVTDTTAKNPSLEKCVAGRVRTWQFPKPKGGGIVIVTYPFFFKQSGA